MSEREAARDMLRELLHEALAAPNGSGGAVPQVPTPPVAAVPESLIPPGPELTNAAVPATSGAGSSPPSPVAVKARGAGSSRPALFAKAIDFAPADVGV